MNQIYYHCEVDSLRYAFISLLQSFFLNDSLINGINLKSRGFILTNQPNGFRFQYYDLENGMFEKIMECSKESFLLFFYDFLSQQTTTVLPFGILTGVRPVKLIRNMKNKGLTDEEIRAKLLDMRVQKDKINILFNVFDTQKDIIENSQNKLSIYIHIPFCHSICNYCSFGSFLYDKNKKHIKEYIKHLEVEIKSILPLIKNETIQTVYIGGGTPSSLQLEEMERLFSMLHRHLSWEEECSFEAGRPDSLNYQKLQSLKQFGVNRLSINPQTMHDATLQKIGRAHSSQDVREIFNMARELKFDNINMDVIMGFENETVSDFLFTMQEIQKMDPDSLTFHPLTRKRASQLKKECFTFRNISEFYDIAHIFTKKMDMHPYYLYRQKNTSSNIENIAFSKRNKEGIYNILMMEEAQSIIGIGAGAVTKILQSNHSIKRYYNTKDIFHYMQEKEKAKKIKFLYEEAIL